MNPPNKKVAQIVDSGNRDQSGPCWRFHQLPQALTMDILSRLSPNTLLTCRCVCKPWLGMISDPLFNRLRHSRSPIGILIQTYPHVRNWKLRKLYFTHVVEESAGPDLQIERMTFRPKISIPVSADNYYYARRCGLINSCNGLLLLAGPNNRKHLFVCNPITGEFISTPPFADEVKVNSVVGLGFSVATNEYKVLITYLLDRVLIYTIGTGVWRDIGVPLLKYAQLEFNAFLHGALHWTSEYWTGDDFMQSFNFETEKFEIVPPPGQFAVSARKYKLQQCSLGVLEGCLLLCGFVGNTTEFEMWIMRDYGVQESWTKTFVIESLYPREKFKFPLREEFRPIMFLSNGEILMSYVVERMGAVVCYNPETKKYRETSIALTESAFVATGYSPSCFTP